MNYLETNQIERMLKPPFKDSDIYTFYKIIKVNNPNAVQKIVQNRYYQVNSEAFFDFCKKNNIELEGVTK